ncbi:molybdopterin-dependent oxidoreductase [Ascidiaceihabitans sp.]|uniref:molybdopterin-dependent oxidoreductase n=1 Tax=Ascidiaceihabitans sp. TaxID=1872644 RepID=UPI00329A78F5
MSLINTLYATVTALSLTAFPAFAEVLAAPKGPVLLTISGELEHQTAGAVDGTVTLDLDILQSLETQIFTTSTIWIEGDVEFTGVSLRDVLTYAGATGAAVRAIASNDYKVEIPADGVSADAPIVAYFMYGEEMSARGKGPLWVVYPYDDDAKYRTEVVYSRSIWQLDRIEIAN